MTATPARRFAARPVGRWLLSLTLTLGAAAQDLDRKVPVVVPGLGPVAWAHALAGPPTIVSTHSGVSATWTEIRPDGSLSEFTLASADGRSFNRPLEFDARLALRYAEFDPLDAEPDVPPALAAGPDTNVYIVQFTGAIVPGMLTDLADAGATPRAFLPHFAYIATIPREALAPVRALPGVRAVVAYHPAYRLDEDVRRRLFESAEDDLPAPGGQPAPYSIQTLAPGPSLKGELVTCIQAAGGTVESVTEAGALVAASLTPGQLLAVLRCDAVLFIDPDGQPSCDMDIIREIGGANAITAELGFTGQGVRALVVDDNVRETHCAFQSPPISFLTPHTGETTHGTPCYGVMFGTGDAFGPGRGLLPDAQQGYFADFDFMPDRVALALEAGGETHRCVLQANSWGHPWTFTYTTHSAEMDLTAFASGMLIVQSQSNSGGQYSRPEAWAKNVISVGGVRHGNTLDVEDDCYCGLASTGPAADGRIKPDLALHNDNVATTTFWGDEAYTLTFGGTSAAAAGIGGYAGLVYQMWHEGTFAGFGGGVDVFASRPAASTVRALLINTAFRYEFSGPTDELSRVRQGWGVPRLANLHSLREGMLIVDQSMPLQVGQSIEFPFIVAPGTADLSATMAYRDPPGTTSALLHRINDLTLVAISPGGAEYWGNWGLTSGNASTPGGSPDVRNVIENLFIPDPEAGTWVVRVFASEVNQDARPETPELDADFSLVITRRVVNSCDADWNRDKTVNSTDVSDFISDWFADMANGTDVTDFDRNGLVNSTDVSAFINSYFHQLAAGCG